MKVRSLLTLLTIFIIPEICRTQDLNNKILLTVDGRKTEAGEFIRMYRKIIVPGKNTDIEDYLKQFILFKLKVADAIRLGYDTTKAFKSELKGYRNQLSQNYLTDTRIKEKLVRSAYQRSLTEVNAWHILIALSPEANPEDTLKAWNKAINVRKRILAGEPFEVVARSVSDDKSVLTNGGNLGYFTAFQMIMPFEDASYALKIGEISQPVRTPYGYHIIKVINRRPSKGRIKVAHIMKATPPGIDETLSKKAREDIFAIYNKLKEGASFSNLAATYSDHKESAVKGGELDWFGAGETLNDFSEAAFAIRDTGTYTKPVHTLYGWHIIKLLAKKPPLSYQEARPYLESKINQSYLNSISKKSFVEKLKKEYKFAIVPESFNWFVQKTDTLVMKGLKKYERRSMPSGFIYTFANKGATNKEFADYVEKRGNIMVTRDSVAFINQTIETKVSDQLINYENSLLEKKNPEFRYLMNEFHDGLLLFEISGRKVWNKVNQDTAGLRKFYEANKNNYLTKQGIYAKLYTLRTQDGEKELASAWKKYSGKSERDNLLLKKFNRRHDSLLVISGQKWFKGDDAQIDGIKWEKGSQTLNRNGLPSIIEISDLIEPVPLSFESVKGDIITAYQKYLEAEWLGQLKKKYNVNIDNSVLVEVKKKLEHE